MIVPGIIVPILLLIVLGIIIEHHFEPRIDVTKDHDVVLWYNNSGKRVYTMLFKLK